MDLETLGHSKIDPAWIVDVDITSNDTRQNWRALAAEWAQQPPFYVLTDGAPQLVVGRYADVREVLTSPPERFTSIPIRSPAWSEALNSEEFMGDRSAAVGMQSGEAHVRIRRILQPFFSRDAIDRYEPDIERHIVDLVEEAKARGGAFDLIADFSRQLIPRIMLGSMFGLDEEERRTFVRANEARGQLSVAEPLPGPLVETLIATCMEARRAADDIIARRAAKPGDDFISGLVLGRSRGEPISDDEIYANVLAIYVGALSTTSTATAMTLYSWMHHRELFAALRNDAEGLSAAIEESLRLNPTGIFIFPRIAAGETVIGGTPVFDQTCIQLCAAAANLDPTVYPDPLRFDIRRAPKHTMVFGAGPHFCVGAILARRIVQASLRIFLDRYPDLHLVDPEYKVVYRGRPGEAAPTEMWVSLQ